MSSNDIPHYTFNDNHELIDLLILWKQIRALHFSDRPQSNIVVVETIIIKNNEITKKKKIENRKNNNNE